MKTIRQTLLLIIALNLTGCLASKTPQTTTKLPERHALPTVQTERSTPDEGTIFSSRTQGLYDDRRAHSIGDILLVEIVETTSAQNKASTDSKRDSSASGDINFLFRFDEWVKHKALGTNSKTLDVDFKNSFKGEGETKRDSTMMATISARVIDITIDGNLVVQGYREIRTNNETQYIIINGLVRPDDISPNNSIQSSHMADARIEITGEGVISDKQQPGWFGRGLDMLWPF